MKRSRIGRRALARGVVVALAVLAVPWLDSSASGETGASPASAFGPAPEPPASYWQIGYYTPSPKGTLSYAEAFRGSGIASLNFTTLPNTALLITGQKAKYPSLLGNRSTATSIATNFTLGSVSGLFKYFGEPSCGLPAQDGGPTANFRFYFQTSNAGGFNETHYWWSNPVSWPLIGPKPNETMTLKNPFGSGSGAFWSDYFGHFGSDPAYKAGFEEAISNVTDIGVSFGGGCFFENGVGETNGSGTFTLNSFNVE
jgi:hypothetical protein